MAVSHLDRVIRRLAVSHLFKKGWGNSQNFLKILEIHRLISRRDTCFKLVSKDYPVTILHKITHKDCQIIEGKFLSPFALQLPGIVSQEVAVAYFQLVLPLNWTSENYKPICIHLAGTGDHFFWMRRNLMAKPLLKYGIGALILENPYYGLRKPLDQFRSSLHNVSDIFVMGGCLSLECLVLLDFCEKMGFGPLGISGLSMGGFMASLAATNWPKPLVLVPCLSGSTASSVFTEGVMSDAINWDLLQEQYCSDGIFYNTLSKLCRIVDDPFKCSLSCVPEFDFDLLNKNKMVHAATNKSLTPYEILSTLESVTRNSDVLQIRRNHNSLFSPKCNISKMKKRAKEAVWFMRGIMDEFTHLKNFSMPYDTSLATIVCAKDDAYVPRLGYSNIEELWPGSTVHFINSGHVGAYLWHTQVFRNSIVAAFEKAKTVCASKI